MENAIVGQTAIGGKIVQAGGMGVHEQDGEVEVVNIGTHWA